MALAVSVFEDSAVAYAQNQGFPVLPLKPRGKLPITQHGLDDATTDVMTIETWWSRWPQANVGIRTGTIVVVDEDIDGTLSRLADEHGQTIPPTTVVRTGTGHHYYFTQPGSVTIRNTAGKLAPGVDTRGEGGYVVAPPSIHPNGATYAWETTDPIPPLPEWIAELLTTPETERTKLTLVPTAGATTPYGQRAVEAETHAVATAPEGQRNNRLNIAAFSLGQLVSGGEVDETDAHNALSAAARACGLGEKEAVATITSGLTSGLLEPRTAPERQPAAHTKGATKTHDQAPPLATSIRAVDGATFIMDEPAEIPACWGNHDQVIWAEGEGLMIVGPDGVGKTTLAQQLVLARIGVTNTLLNEPVQQAGGRVLYIAADRPRQAARSFGRMVTTADYQILRERLIVWRGPLPFDITRDKDALSNLAEELEITDLFIDSLKDIALDLSKDETGSRVNVSLQEVIARNIQTCVLHHQRKEGRDGTGKPKRLADVYGSRWLTAGMGSVVCIWGEPGDPLVEFIHLKQPAEDVGPLRLLHDHTRGKTTIETSTSVNEILAEHKHSGLEVRQLAERLYQKNDPHRGEIEKARRRLESLVDRGFAEKIVNVHGVTVYKPCEK